MKPRAIIHLDLDAFYASVEQLDFPELAGRPVIVGGSFERGVVCACSYEARAFGVRSAMAMAKAARLCPAAEVRPVRMARYKELSERVFAVFRRFTDRVEPLSIDEAFLDVTGCERLYGSPLEIARNIILEVNQSCGLIVSAGVAPNKFLAKLASSRSKPAGLLEIKPEQVDAFLLPLPVESIWGVGPKTAESLHRLGIRTVAQLRRLDRSALEGQFGQAGGLLFELSRGIDDRKVLRDMEIQSMGAEETFAADLTSEHELNREMLRLAVKVSGRVRRAGLRGRKLSLKIKYADFSQVSRSTTVSNGVDTTELVYRLAKKLLREHRRSGRSIRLLGIYLSDWVPPTGGQQGLFGDEQSRERSLDAAIDQVQTRFGATGVVRGTLLETDGSEERRKRRR